jgi:hypothetical protein
MTRMLRRVDLSAASDSELARLSKACQPATFGVNQQDVHDESYRKAGKMDVSDFAAKFNLERSGILEQIHSHILEGHDVNKTIDAELYKLNVYGTESSIVGQSPCAHSSEGPGSFFKSHKDTPRGETMFASLVIVFPTLHDGGSLMLRHEGKEWTFDSAREVTGQSSPSIAYIAFYSDVEHEVMPVKTGYRVTLTYNLYFGTRNLANHVVASSEHGFQSTLSELLNDPRFLPEGGYIGFGLRYQYPIESPGSRHASNLQSMLNYLKGSDAVVKKICETLSLECSLQIIYRGEEEDVMVNHAVHLDGYGEIDRSMDELLREDEGGVFVRAGLWKGRWEDTDYKRHNAVAQIWWITDMTPFNDVKTPYVAYGNQSSIGYLYGKLVLIVHIGPSDRRAVNSMV